MADQVVVPVVGKARVSSDKLVQDVADTGSQQQSRETDTLLSPFQYPVDIPAWNIDTKPAAFIGNRSRNHFALAAKRVEPQIG